MDVELVSFCDFIYNFLVIAANYVYIYMCFTDFKTFRLLKFGIKYFESSTQRNYFESMFHKNAVKYEMYASLKRLQYENCEVENRTKI